MIAVVGLGNPEKEYKNTRHNVGFEVVNQFGQAHGIQMQKVKFHAHVGEGMVGGQKILLLKPQTYMNLSGLSVSEMLRFYQLTPAHMIVVYDDITLDVGDIRIREKGSAGGHNGIKHIIGQLGTDTFLRVKVGIGEKPKHFVLSDYVLSTFSKAEAEAITFGIQRASDAVTAIIQNGVDKAMNEYNRKNRGEKE